MLIDVFGADERFGARSGQALRTCRAEGGLIACDVTWAEVVAGFASSGDAEHALRTLGVKFSSVGPAASAAAGDAWRIYRRQGGARERLIPNLLIGAHALLQAERLLSRDRGFYRRHFDGLDLMDPSAD